MRVLLSSDDLGRWAPGHSGVMDSEALERAYAYPEITPGKCWVRANFVATLDGAAAGEDGRSGTINTGADRNVFALLRALSDVVLVGAGTARVEGYRRAIVRAPWLDLRDGRPAHPTMAVVSRSGDIPPRMGQAREDSGDLLLITCKKAGAEAIELAKGTLGTDRVLVEGDESVDLAAAIDTLAGQGLGRILCEGGPHLMRDLTASGRLDELCLTLAPTMVAGDHPRITSGAPVAASFTPVLLIESEGTILGRWVIR